MIFFYAERSTMFGNCEDFELRLENRSSPLEGRVEVCMNNAWGTICTEGASEDDVEVICKQLGRLPDGMFHKSVVCIHKGLCLYPSTPRLSSKISVKWFSVL